MPGEGLGGFREEGEEGGEEEEEEEEVVVVVEEELTSLTNMVVPLLFRITSQIREKKTMRFLTYIMCMDML